MMEDPCVCVWTEGRQCFHGLFKDVDEVSHYIHSKTYSAVLMTSFCPSVQHLSYELGNGQYSRYQPVSVSSKRILWSQPSGFSKLELGPVLECSDEDLDKRSGCL